MVRVHQVSNLFVSQKNCDLNKPPACLVYGLEVSDMLVANRTGHQVSNFSRKVSSLDQATGWLTDETQMKRACYAQSVLLHFPNLFWTISTLFEKQDLFCRGRKCNMLVIRRLGITSECKKLLESKKTCDYP
jgi:hypothetical protein